MKTAGRHQDNSTLKDSRRSAKRRSWRKLIFVCLAITLLPNLVSLAIPQRIHVSTHELFIKNLPPSVDQLTVVQISDIHRCIEVPDSLIRSAVKTANEAKPDFVVLTGDFVSNSAKNADECAVMLSDLRAKHGVFAVLGNHDYWTDWQTVVKELRDRDIAVLINENRQIFPGVFILGLDDYWSGKPNYPRMLKGVPEDSVQIVLSHNPRASEHMSGRSCLVFSGHTHGLQLHLPFMPGHWMPGLNGSRYVKGWYTNGKARIYVNEGVGMPTIPLRAFHHPEVAVFKLKRVRK